MIIDTHAHLNFNAYKDDVDEVIRQSLDNEVWMINVGSQYNTSKRAVEIAESASWRNEGIYAAVGLHPIHLAGGTFKTPKQSLRDATGQAKIDQEEIEFKTREEEFDCEKYLNLAKSPKVVAIGEIGLDYYYKPKTTGKLTAFKEKQKEVFLKQLDLAQELNLPVIFHCRMAHDELIEILKLHISRFKLQGVVHCFTGTSEQAEKYLKMGFYLGFNGIIFKLNCDEVIKNIPLERILVETDCPYLTPPPATLRKRACSRSDAGGAIIEESINRVRNEPIYVKYIIEKIAKIKNISYEKVAEITTENAKTLFKI